jgi:cytochrome P450
MTIRSERRPAFDPLAPSFLEDPYPSYAQLRAAGPLVRDGATQWVAARYAPVAQLLRDPRLRGDWPEGFQAMRVGPNATKDFLFRVLLHREDAEHADLRRLLNACMHVLSAPQMRASIEVLVDQKLQQAGERGHLEVMADLALPIPAAVACEMIGIPAADRVRIQAWGLEIIKAFTVIMPEPDRDGVDLAVEQLRAYLRELVAAPTGRLAQIVSQLDQAEQNGSVDRDALIDNLIFLLVSGFTTTVHLIASVSATLLQHPDVATALRADPGLVPGAVEEFIRYDCPIQHVSRYAAEPITIEGQTIRAGRIVHLLLGSANRDERQFADPGRIDIRRKPNAHVGFGVGVHACIGAGLGRLEATILLDRILRTFSVFEPDGDLVRRPVQVFRTYQRIPVAVGTRGLPSSRISTLMKGGGAP